MGGEDPLPSVSLTKCGPRREDKQFLQIYGHDIDNELHI